MRRIISMLAITTMLASCGGNTDENASDNNTMQEGNNTSEMPADNADQESAPGEAAEPMTQTQTQEVERTVKAVGETMTEMSYEPTRIEVPAGAKVTLTLENTAKSAAMIHNLVVIKAGKQSEITEAGMKAGSSKDYIPENQDIIAAVSLTKPGETNKVEFTAPSSPGTYQYICTYPGHTAMKGVLIVK